MKKLQKKILSLALAITMLFVTFASSMPVDAASFTPRLTKPSTSNKYYYSNINPFYAAGLGLPNCTAYAYGRVYEITGKKPNLSTGNAKDWWAYNKNNGFYKYGQTPKLGAVAVWGGYGSHKYGHVAVVEKITDTTVTVSESQYSSKVVFTTTNFKKGDMNYSWNKNFLGFIYPGEFTDSGDTSTPNSTNPLSYPVPTRAIYYTNPVMTGNDVKYIQAGLKKLGYDVSIDGSFGPSAKEATKKFQAANGLTADGSFGPATLKKLRQLINDPYLYPVPTRAIYYTSPVMTGEDVKFIQAGLKYLGYSITVDGSFGPSAKEVTKKFQAANGLTADGSFGPSTLSKLQQCLKK